MKEQGNGRWVVIGIVVLGVVLALVGLKFRRFPEGDRPGETAPPPATTRAG